jgi:hypothetical protein
MNQVLEPAYQIKTLSSKAESTEWLGLGAVIQEINNGYAVLWQHHAVFTGQINDGNIQWLNSEQPVDDDKHLVRLRAFNENQEYHFWRTSDGIKGRLRRDGGTESKADVIDTQMVLRSVVANPLKKVNVEFAEGTLAVLTRNYIGYDNDTKQAGYVDSRFVNFEQFNTE